MSDLAGKGWMLFDADPRTRHWAETVRPAAEAAVREPANQQWMQCEGTWFVGVDCLPNAPDGSVDGSGPLAGAAVDFITARLGGVPPLHRAQVSAVYPGYPKPRTGESEGAFRYRLTRDAAHVDGLLPEGADRRRMLREPHAWILGLPLTPATPGASPLVVWEGSAEIMGDAFRAAFEAVPETEWDGLDLTEVYHAARREVFATCPRRTVVAGPGQAILVHRHALHGIAPWTAQSGAASGGRVVAYFRPQLPGGIADWLKD